MQVSGSETEPEPDLSEEDGEGSEGFEEASDQESQGSHEGGAEGSGPGDEPQHRVVGSAINPVDTAPDAPSAEVGFCMAGKACCMQGLTAQDLGLCSAFI